MCVPGSNPSSHRIGALVDPQQGARLPLQTTQTSSREIHCTIAMGSAFYVFEPKWYVDIYMHKHIFAGPTAQWRAGAWKRRKYLRTTDLSLCYKL